MKLPPLPELVVAVRRGEIDLRDVALTGILREAFAAELDFDARAESIWLAANLIQLKIGQLLPAPPCPPLEPEEDDLAAPATFDRDQLRQAAGFLQERLAGGASWPAAGESETAEEPALPAGLNLLDIVQLARKALETARAHQQIGEATPELVKIEDMIRLLEEALAETGGAALGLDELLEAQPDPARRVSLFLAVLELVRTAKVRIDQGEAFSPISVHRTSSMAV